MQLVFTKDIPGRDGIKFNRGDMRDYPKSTWQQMAKNLRTSLGAFTMAPEQANAIATKGQSSQSESTRGEVQRRTPVMRRKLKG